MVKLWRSLRSGGMLSARGVGIWMEMMRMEIIKRVELIRLSRIVLSTVVYVEWAS